MSRILLKPKGEISLKAVLEAFNVNTLAEMFGQECQKDPNCWELKESSKRTIILNLSCLFCFGHCEGQDNNLGGPLVWHSWTILTYTHTKHKC